MTLSAGSVAAVFASHPPAMRDRLLHLRALILDTAAMTPGVGTLEESLKWGQPSYLSRIGSPIRLDGDKSAPGRCALYFICTTSLVATFRELYPELRFGGARGILLDEGDPLPEAALRHCIALALTYRRRAPR